MAVTYKTDGLHELEILDRRSAVGAGLSFSDVLAMVAEWAGIHPGGLVFIDTLAIWAGLDNENDASEAGRGIAAISHVAQTADVAIVLIHHARKSGGTNGEAIRGSGAFLATVDIAAELSRDGDGDDRSLDVQGRVISPERFRLLFDRDARVYSIGDRAEAKRAEIEGYLVGIPADGPGVTRERLHRLWGKDPRRRADQLVGVGRLRMEQVVSGRTRVNRYWSMPAAPPLRSDEP